MSGFTIQFEAGDKVHCTYYDATGTITGLVQKSDIDLPHIIIKTDNDARVVTRARMQSGKNFYYLQMIKKKTDEEK